MIATSSKAPFSTIFFLFFQDYVKWEEWWYKYQEWLKQERYYEMWERSRMNRHRKKVPIAQRLN